MNIPKQRRLTTAIRLAAGVFATTAAVAQAQVVDLAELGTAYPGFRIDGAAGADRSGGSVSGAGDVNGDGLDDVIIGAADSDPNGNSAAGESYVVFGKADGTTLDLANLGAGGFRITGIAAGDRSGVSVSGAGDVNGDGLDDVIIGAHNADPNGISGAGESYVVFGKADGATVDLANLGAGGFRIAGIDAGDLSGRSVSGAGDVNGDGLDDVIIGARGADAGALNGSGESYVVFGKADVTPVDLADLGTGGFRIDGIDALDRSGASVSGAGDVNGDGLDDLIIGAFNAELNGNIRVGESYVVFGKADPAAVSLASLGTGGFRIDGIDSNDYSGYSVSGAGDVNGDGLDDLIIGAFRADPNGNEAAGESYVVFGKASDTTVDLANLGAGGFRIDGIDAEDLSGFSVSGAGDVNGDGLDDVIIGAREADPGGIKNAGESYVVFGKASGTTVDLANLGAGGFRIDGIAVSDRSGFSVSGAGDVNGDGLADLIVGAPDADRNGASSGESYLVFGNQDAVDTAALSAPAGLAAGDRFGGAVATDGNLFVVGLPNADGASADSGRVVVYRVEGTTIIEDHAIDVPDTHFATNFGAALALEGGRLVVGAPGTEPAAAKGGGLAALQAAIFERLNDGSWTMTGSLSAMNGNAGDEFGASVALDGNMVVVGAPGDAEGMDSGAAYVYELANNTVMQSLKLKPAEGPAGGRFGASVATDNGVIAVGAPDETVDGTRSGLVGLFQQVGDNLTDLDPLGTVTGSQSDEDDGFGTAVALDGDTMVVGAPGEGTDSGAAYVFDPQGLVERGRLVPATPQDNAAFGRAVAANGHELAIGAPGLDAGAGGAYRFNAATLVQTRLTWALAGQQEFGAAISLSDDGLVIGAPASDSAAGAAVVQRNPALVYRSGFE